jgi:hypothetical protein
MQKYPRLVLPLALGLALLPACQPPTTASSDEPLIPKEGLEVPISFAIDDQTVHVLTYQLHQIQGTGYGTQAVDDSGQAGGEPVWITLPVREEFPDAEYGQDQAPQLRTVSREEMSTFLHHWDELKGGRFDPGVNAGSFVALATEEDMPPVHLVFACQDFGMKPAEFMDALMTLRQVTPEQRPMLKEFSDGLWAHGLTAKQFMDDLRSENLTLAQLTQRLRESKRTFRDLFEMDAALELEKSGGIVLKSSKPTGWVGMLAPSTVAQGSLTGGTEFAGRKMTAWVGSWYTPLAKYVWQIKGRHSASAAQLDGNVWIRDLTVDFLESRSVAGWNTEAQLYLLGRKYSERQGIKVPEAVIRMRMVSHLGPGTGWIFDAEEKIVGNQGITGYYKDVSWRYAYDTSPTTVADLLKFLK